MKRFISFEPLITILLLLITTFTAAQELSFENGKKYILGGLEVTGLQSYNEQTVKTYTGLRVGQPITIPGDEISAIINKLWGLELFRDIDFYITDIDDDRVFLELHITERSTLSDIKINGVKPRKVDGILDDTDLKKGKKITESLIANTKNYLENKYKKEGYLNAKVAIAVANDTSETNAQKMVINVNKGDKVKIAKMIFEGNEELSDKRLRGALKKTKQKQFFRFWKKSKFIEEDYENDKQLLIDRYAENGYRDARIISDSIIKVDENNINIKFELEEGDKYYFGDIDFVGNTVYTDRQLATVLGIKKGNTYNGVQLRERIADDSKPDAEDLTNLYQNNGYLFSSINPVEVSAQNDTINFEIRIIEGKETFLNHVDVVGNDRTNDHVIYRELRTRPGQKYSKSDIIRTIRELQQLGYFDAEAIKPDILNANPNEGTVDVKWGLVESGASQIELQGGYGGGGFIGTLGLSFNNFSIAGIFDKEAYKPLPMGDGQTLSLRAQASIFYQTYSLSFVEPWLGGKKPVSLSTSFSYTRQFLYDYQSRKADKSRSFDILGINVGLAKRLQWPDDYFTLSQSVGIQRYDLNNYNTGLFTFGNGYSNNLTYTIGLSRQSLATNPIFPIRGSDFSVSAKFTPPYSLWNGVDYANLESQREFQLKDENGNLIKMDGTRLRPGEEPVGDQSKIDQEKFKWLEFYKVKFKGDWYTTLFNFGGNSNLVMKTHAEYGFLGAYNNDRGIPPFERFYLGGDGLGSFSLDGRETVALRGYPNQSLVPLDRTSLSQANNDDGAVIYNKYSLELRL